MRISLIAVLVSVGGGLVMALPAFTPEAWAVQDQPVTVGGVEMVCTGVGSAKDDPAWAGYPIKLTFSNLSGQNVASEHIVISANGRTVVETDCDGPWLLVKAPAGKYDVVASLPGANVPTASASFTTSGSGAQQSVNIAFPAVPPAP